MTTYSVNLDQLSGLLKIWSREYELWVPAAVGQGFYDFVPWREGVEIAFDYDLAYNSLKRFFLPAREDLLKFDLRSYTATPVFEAPKQLLFGVHHYDLRAVNQLDQLMEAGSVDQYYFSRREATLIFAMDPAKVADKAFWSSVGSVKVDYGFDLYWTKISSSDFTVEVGSLRGEELLLAGGELFVASPGEREAARKVRRKLLTKARQNALSYDWRETPKLMDKYWNAKLWRKKSEMCLACGTCNLVCPTCYCFDIREEVDEKLEVGSRYRVWDGCMLTSFANVAGGHNFRGKALERYRHRYMRKGKYIFEKIGELGCVGCGRCVRSCTTQIANPKEVFNALWEASQNED